MQAALNILDRFHIAKKFGEAVGQVRKEEVKQFKANNEENVQVRGKWLLLKKKQNLTEKQASRLGELVKLNLNCIRAYLMKEDFNRFWGYRKAGWAEKYMDDWIERALETDLKPMHKVAKMLTRHKALILNWFKAGVALSSGAVEGLNNKAKLTIKKGYGFKSYDCLKIALYHQPSCTLIKSKNETLRQLVFR